MYIDDIKFKLTIKQAEFEIKTICILTLKINLAYYFYFN